MVELPLFMAAKYKIFSAMCELLERLETAASLGSATLDVMSLEASGKWWCEGGDSTL